MKREILLLTTTFLLLNPLLKAKGDEITSNFGRTGLLIDPTAYVIKDGYLKFGMSYSYPYQRFFGGVGFFPGLELGGVITEIKDIKVKGGIWTNYGVYKDKAFFAKYQILPETEKFPAIAIGWDDFHGTRLFETKYLVLTKYVDALLPQNMTIGYASGVIDGFFFGSEVLLHPKFSFITEYAPIKPEKLKGIKRVKSKWNFGLKWQPLSWLQTVFSIQRGDKLSFNVNFSMPMGKPWLPHKKRYFILSKRDIKLIKSNRELQFFKIALKRLGFKYAYVYREGDNLIIEYSNASYFYESVAIRKILSVFKVLYIPGIRKVTLISKKDNIPITQITIPASAINNYLFNRINFYTLLNEASWKVPPKYKPKVDVITTKPKYYGAIKLRTFLNDPSGAFKYMLSYDIGIKEYFLNNFYFNGSVILPIRNNISSVVPPLMKKPVRSDIDKYLDNKHPDVSTLAVTYIKPIASKTFFDVSLGYNELMFAGIGGDIIHFLGNGRTAIIAGGDWVRKRDSENTLKLKDYGFHDFYVGVNYITKYPEMHISIKLARFLAGDKGIRFQISRVVKGFEVGFWYTISDTSKFSSFNKNYHDKGVFVAVPLRMFKFRDTKQVGYYSLSPWTRDVGQLAGRPVDVYQILLNKMPFYLKDKSSEEE
ncbi:YjbH domain-containing protein [Thermovibrio sp.]